MANDAAPSSTASSAREPHPHDPSSARGAGLAKLAVAALGVVYGDIGTSPLYAVKECFGRVHGVDPSVRNILGVLSLIVWSLLFVI